MALPKHSLLYVSERDIDLLLVEELTVSPAFGKWMAQRAGLELSDSARPAGVWHSVTHPALGESDLIAMWREPDGCRAALLIEDKIDVCAQHGYPSSAKGSGPLSSMVVTASAPGRSFIWVWIDLAPSSQRS